MKGTSYVFLTQGLLGCCAVLCLAACDAEQPQSALSERQTVAYPESVRGDVIDVYFGQQVSDPYRWLEDDRSAETLDWVQRQNAVTRAYLNELPGRDRLRDRLTRLLNYERETAPFTEGEYTYFYRNNGLQNQSVVYRVKQGETNESVFLDPNTFSADGTVSMSALSFSADGSMAAYQLSEGGSDWRTIKVIDTQTLASVGEPIEGVKFSAISWLENEGFYYSRYDQPDGSVLSAMTDRHKLYFHRLGTNPSEDPVIFGDEEQQRYRYVSGQVSEDNRFLAIYASQSTSGNALYLIDHAAEQPRLITVQSDLEADTELVYTLDSTLYLQTNRGAPNQRLIRVDVSHPSPEHWTEVIPEREQVLDVVAGAGYLFAQYMVDALSKVEQYDLDGQLIREIALPGPGSASGFSAKPDDEVVYFAFTNYQTPSTLMRLIPDTGETAVYRVPRIEFDASPYHSRQVFYPSADGTLIPMIITARKDLAQDGSHPAILYGYGGFNVSLEPSFSSTIAAWLEEGGIYAVANLRGGGEYGQQWHLAGTRLNKQNVFDDFIGAAEFLIDEGYTRSDRLAIRGGSNGGLLVGAVMTQRPDLIAVALPAVGVLDMLRYHTFTAGAGWAYDYGRSDESPEMFEYLFGYSPLHNVQSGQRYPATLITTADHDDRVVPAHSFKFAAELQAKQGGDAPVLIRIETDAGHGAGTPVSKVIDQYVDLYAFTLFHLRDGRPINVETP